jgi:hypothetical protein
MNGVLKVMFVLTVSTDINDLRLSFQQGKEIFLLSCSAQNPKYDTDNG